MQCKILHPSPIKSEQNLPYCQHLNQSDMEIWIYALVKREPNYQIVWEVALLLLLHISPHFHFLPNSDSSPPDSSASNCFGAFLRQHGRWLWLRGSLVVGGTRRNGRGGSHSSLPPAPCPKTQSPTFQVYFLIFSSVFLNLFRRISFAFSSVLPVYNSSSHSSLPPAPYPKTQSQPHFPHFSSVFLELFKRISFAFSSVFSFIIHPFSDLVQNRFKRLTTTQNNYVVILCGFLDIYIFDKFSHGNKYLLICWIRITRLFNF